MQRILKGSTAQITFIKYTDANISESGYFSGKKLDAVVVQENDMTKFVHKLSSDIDISSNGSAITFTLTPEDTSSIDGYSNVEVRDTTENTPVSIFQSIRSIDFIDNKIHTITA